MVKSNFFFLTASYINRTEINSNWATLSDFKDIGIRKYEFVAKTQFLSSFYGKNNLEKNFPGHLWVSTKKFSPIGPVVWPAIRNIYT